MKSSFDKFSPSTILLSMENPAPDDLKNAWDNRPPSKMFLVAQIGLFGSGLVGLFKQPILILLPCILAVLLGESLRIIRRNRPHGISGTVILGLLFSSVIFCGMTYGIGRAVASIAEKWSAT